MKIKLFTHTDLDGVGCAVLAYLAFGRENVDVEYCNYDDINDAIDRLNEYEFISYNPIRIGVQHIVLREKTSSC